MQVGAVAKLLPAEGRRQRTNRGSSLDILGDMRVGMALESGKVGGRFTETNREGWQNSLAIYAGGETPLGPVYAGYGYAPNGMSNIYIFVGTP